MQYLHLGRGEQLIFDSSYERYKYIFLRQIIQVLSKSVDIAIKLDPRILRHKEQSASKKLQEAHKTEKLWKQYALPVITTMALWKLM